MKSKAVFVALIAFLCGCAHRPSPPLVAPASPAPTQRRNLEPSFAGRAKQIIGEEAEAIWAEQLKKVAPGRENKAIVRAVRGDAVVWTPETASWKNAKVGAALAASSQVWTTEGSTVDLFLGDNGPVIRVTGNSVLSIARMNVEATGIEKVIDTMLEVPQGKIMGSVKKMAEASSYLVRTRSGVMKIRGTEFSATADGVFNIITGTGIIHREGKTIQIIDGEGYDPKIGVRKLPVTVTPLD